VSSFRARHDPRRHGPAGAAAAWQELRERRRKSVFPAAEPAHHGNLFCGFCAMLLTVEARYTEGDARDLRSP